MQINEESHEKHDWPPLWGRCHQWLQFPPSFLPRFFFFFAGCSPASRCAIPEQAWLSQPGYVIAQARPDGRFSLPFSFSSFYAVHFRIRYVGNHIAVRSVASSSHAHHESLPARGVRYPTLHHRTLQDLPPQLPTLPTTRT